MSRPRLLDLFCGAGGAGMGYHLAGFDVVGVDLKPQPRYPFAFVQGDALDYLAKHGHEFDAVHASPPCQAHSTMKSMHNARSHASLISATRDLLVSLGVPYVIENVVGAPLLNPTMLCGSMFRLRCGSAHLRRHRIFEASIPLEAIRCVHGGRGSRTIGIYGEGCRDSRRKFDKTIPEFTVAEGRIAMGIPWMTLAELCQAIPPAYTEYLGRHLLAHVQHSEAA